MAIISSRLKSVMSKVRPEVQIPIIVEVADLITMTALKDYMTVTYMSKVLPTVYGTATPSAINTIAGLGFVKEVSYDEPTYSM